MKIVFLLRHAKSSWDHGSLADHERPLAPRGIKAASVVGAHMREAGYLPDLVLCSTAKRTRETLELVLSELDAEAHVEWDEGIYLAAPEHLLEVLQTAPDTAESILMVGHNPGTGMLADALCGEGPTDQLRLMATKFPTAGLAIIELRVDRWEEVRVGCGTLREFTRPRDIT